MMVDVLSPFSEQTRVVCSPVRESIRECRKCLSHIQLFLPVEWGSDTKYHFCTVHTLLISSVEGEVVETLPVTSYVVLSVEGAMQEKGNQVKNVGGRS